MGVELVARRMFAQQVAAGADIVCAGMWLPANTVLNRVRGYATFEAAVERGLNQVAMGALACYVLPVPDPDGTDTMNTIWNRFVPKDESADLLDFDTDTAITTEFWNPGAQKWEVVFDVGNVPRRLYQRHFLSSLGMNAIAVNRDPESTFDYEYIGGKTMVINVQGGMRVESPSLVAVAVASPDTLLTHASTPLAAMAEADWGQMQFIDNVMERALLHLTGVTEAGAETPFVEASALLRRHLDPPVLEVSGNIFQPTTWNLVGEMVFDVTVEGRLQTGRIDLGGGSA